MMILLIFFPLVAQVQTPAEPLEPPMEVKALNGSPLARLTHHTVPITLILSGNHWEIIQLMLISSFLAPIVLSLLWLRLHNTHIDWTANKVVCWSGNDSHSHCLKLAITPGKKSVFTPTSPPNLTSEPPCTMTWWRFSVKTRHSHFLLCPYDCAMNLLPGAPLSSTHLYKQSGPENLAMEQYIKDFLAVGIIRPSSSPVAAGFFFMDTKDGTLQPCIDYQGLNNITAKNKYPLPLLDSFEPPPPPTSPPSSQSWI